MIKLIQNSTVFLILELISFSSLYCSKYPYIIFTTNSIPVPLPTVPIKSENTDKTPIQIPPKIAAVVICLFKIL